MKGKEICEVVSQEMIGAGIFSMWIDTPTIAFDAVAGQFVSVYCHSADRLLPRPISLSEIDREQGRLRLVYRVVGKGTAEFSEFKAGDKVSLLGPLGNGFPLNLASGKKILLMGGGIGVPPMLQTAKDLKDKAEVISVMGYKDETFLREEFERYSRLAVATEDGSFGTKGNVMDAIKENRLSADIIFACGPKPMLCAIKAYAQEKQIPCHISLEEKMACGIGACLACVCKTKDVDAHSHVHNARICKDGPVFDASEVEL